MRLSHSACAIGRFLHAEEGTKVRRIMREPYLTQHVHRLTEDCRFYSRARVLASDATRIRGVVSKTYVAPESQR